MNTEILLWAVIIATMCGAGLMGYIGGVVWRQHYADRRRMRRS